MLDDDNFGFKVPMQDYVCSISPTEFEKHCREVLLGYAEDEHLQNFTITHDVKLKASDGTYQIDLYATFTALGAEIKVLCECKQYKSPVKRETVATLDAKLKSLGAHKGILLSTSGFQSGAKEYAAAHGIALFQVYDKECIAVSHDSGTDAIDENDPLLYAERAWPQHCVICWTEKDKYGNPKRIYPNGSIARKIIAEQYRLVCEENGFDNPPASAEMENEK